MKNGRLQAKDLDGAAIIADPPWVSTAEVAGLLTVSGSPREPCEAYWLRTRAASWEADGA